MDSYPRKRNVSDGDSGFDSALSSRSSSISLEESAEFGKLFQLEEDSALLTSKLSYRLKEKFSHVLALDEDIRLVADCLFGWNSGNENARPGFYETLS